jgi:hypothetical protein
MDEPCLQNSSEERPNFQILKYSPEETQKK